MGKDEMTGKIINMETKEEILDLGKIPENDLKILPLKPAPPEDLNLYTLLFSEGEESFEVKIWLSDKEMERIKGLEGV